MTDRSSFDSSITPAEVGETTSDGSVVIQEPPAGLRRLWQMRALSDTVVRRPLNNDSAGDFTSRRNESAPSMHPTQ